MASDDATLILDACALINLAATDHLSDILESIAAPVVICDTVAAEALYLRRGGSGRDASDRDPIDIAPWVAGDRFSVISAESDDELTMFVDLAVMLDDGEAMTIALATHRSLVVVTDDRKAARVASEHGPVESSLALVKAWMDDSALDSHSARAILSQIRERARYVPHRQHPLRPWWNTVLDTASSH